MLFISRLKFRRTSGDVRRPGQPWVAFFESESLAGDLDRLGFIEVEETGRDTPSSGMAGGGRCGSDRGGQAPHARQREGRMTQVDRDELESAFRRYWRTGAVGEDWDAWADLFTEDCTYFEHYYGAMTGREAVRAWIKPIMAKYGEIYPVSHGHTIDVQ